MPRGHGANLMPTGQRECYSKLLKMQTLNRHISCAVWLRVMKLCANVHLLIPNRFFMSTYKHHPLHFLQITLYEKCNKIPLAAPRTLKEKCVVFGAIWWWHWNQGASVGLLLPHTVVAIIHTHMWLNFQTVLLFWNGSLWKHLITHWLVVKKFCRMVEDHYIYMVFWLLGPLTATCSCISFCCCCYFFIQFSTVGFF